MGRRTRKIPTELTTMKGHGGPLTLFHGKLRKPLSFTATKEHKEILDRAEKRLGYSRSDVIALLLVKHGDDLSA